MKFYTIFFQASSNPDSQTSIQQMFPQIPVHILSIPSSTPTTTQSPVILANSNPTAILTPQGIQLIPNPPALQLMGTSSTSTSSPSHTTTTSNLQALHALHKQVASNNTDTLTVQKNDLNPQKNSVFQVKTKPKLADELRRIRARISDDLREEIRAFANEHVLLKQGEIAQIFGEFLEKSKL